MYIPVYRYINLNLIGQEFISTRFLNGFELWTFKSSTQEQPEEPFIVLYLKYIQGFCDNKKIIATKHKTQLPVGQQWLSG